MNRIKYLLYNKVLNENENINTIDDIDGIIDEVKYRITIYEDKNFSWTIRDLETLWYDKIKLLNNILCIENLVDKIQEEASISARNKKLADILMTVCPDKLNPKTIGGGISDVKYNKLNAVITDSLLNELNIKCNTTINLMYLCRNINNEYYEFGSLSTNQGKIKKAGTNEIKSIKNILSGKYTKMSKEVRQVALSAGKTYYATSFADLYDIITKESEFNGRYKKNDNGTISINMTEIPLTMIRSKYGLTKIDKDQSLVYILFGTNKGNSEAISQYMKYKLGSIFLEKYHSNQILKSYYIDYYSLRPCGLKYWWINGNVRFVTEREEKTEIGSKDSNVEITISQDGECTLFINGRPFESEIDPAVNPGNWRITRPVEENKKDKYGFDIIEESKRLRNKKIRRLYEAIDKYGLNSDDYMTYEAYLRDKAEILIDDIFKGLDYEQKQNLIDSLIEQDENEWENWCMDIYTDYNTSNYYNESYINKYRYMLKENKNTEKIITIFVHRLETLCNDLEWLSNYNFEIYNWSSDAEVSRINNIIKTARILSDMYTNNNIFIPEISGNKGYYADEYFYEQSSKLNYMDFPETLNYIADILDGIYNDEEKDEAWETIISYIPLLKTFLNQLCKDYSIDNFI